MSAWSMGGLRKSRQRRALVSKIAFKAGTQNVFTLGDDRADSLLERAVHCSDQHVPVHRAADGLAAILYIQVKGPNVFKGYWHMPEKTAEEFTPDGYFKTGDVGRMDEHRRSTKLLNK